MDVQSFLSLLDHVTQYGPVQAQTWVVQKMASPGVARIYDRKDLELPGNCQIALLSILHATFVANSGSTNLRPSINAKQAENDKELDVAATECFRNPAHHH